VNLCDACETAAWCLGNGCIPIQPAPEPLVWPVIDEALIPEQPAEE
jgi:hypothetical protein